MLLGEIMGCTSLNVPPKKPKKKCPENLIQAIRKKHPNPSTPKPLSNCKPKMQIPWQTINNSNAKHNHIFPVNFSKVESPRKNSFNIEESLQKTQKINTGNPSKGSWGEYGKG
jgi:hypothetical protein